MSGAIRNLDKYAAAAMRRRTERFDHCFPRGITMGDIDSHVEINHHWLFIEYKTGDQSVSTGQMMDLSRLARRARMQVWIIWTTDDGFITHGQRLGFHQSRITATEEQVAKKIKDWVADAEKAPRPPVLESVLDRLFVISRMDSIRAKLMFDVIAELGGEP